MLFVCVTPVCAVCGHVQAGIQGLNTRFGRDQGAVDANEMKGFEIEDKRVEIQRLGQNRACVQADETIETVGRKTKLGSGLGMQVMQDNRIAAGRGANQWMRLAETGQD